MRPTIEEHDLHGTGHEECEVYDMAAGQRPNPMLDPRYVALWDYRGRTVADVDPLSPTDRQSIDGLLRLHNECPESELSSGREFGANAGVLGMDHNGSAVTQGYDGPVEDEWSRKDGRFTAQERREIADYMIERWNRWATKGSAVEAA